MQKPGFTPAPEENTIKYCIDCKHSKAYPDHKMRPKHQLICIRPVENLVTRDVIQAYTDCNTERTAVPEKPEEVDLCGKEAKYYHPKEIR